MTLAGPTCTDDPTTAEFVASLYRRGAARWPDVVLDPAAFHAHVLQRDGQAENASGWDAEGSFLACACLAGNARALRHFERCHGALFVTAIPRHLRQLLPDDFASMMREILLVGGGSRPPRLAKYSGIGALGGWLRVMIMRQAISTARRGRGRVCVAWSPDDDPRTQDDPEHACLRAEARARLTRALEHAARALSHRERHLVAASWLRGHSTRALATTFDVHHATVARWVQHATVKLIEGARACMPGSCDGDDVLDIVGDVDRELST